METHVENRWRTDGGCWWDKFRIVYLWYLYLLSAVMNQTRDKSNYFQHQSRAILVQLQIVSIFAWSSIFNMVAGREYSFKLTNFSTMSMHTRVALPLAEQRHSDIRKVRKFEYSMLWANRKAQSVNTQTTKPEPIVTQRSRLKDLLRYYKHRCRGYTKIPLLHFYHRSIG